MAVKYFFWPLSLPQDESLVIPFSHVIFSLELIWKVSSFTILKTTKMTSALLSRALVVVCTFSRSLTLNVNDPRNTLNSNQLLGLGSTLCKLQENLFQDNNNNYQIKKKNTNFFSYKSVIIYWILAWKIPNYALRYFVRTRIEFD